MRLCNDEGIMQNLGVHKKINYGLQEKSDRQKPNEQVFDKSNLS